MRPKVLLVAGQDDLHVVGVVEAAFPSTVKEFDQVLATHVTDLFDAIISILKCVTPFLTYLMN